MPGASRDMAGFLPAVAGESPGMAGLTQGVSGERRGVRTGMIGPPMNLQIALRHDVASAGVGFVLLGLGLAAGAVAFARRRTEDRTLLAFSVFTTLYAARLLCDLEA